MFKTIAEISKGIADDIVAIGITGSILYMSVMGIAVPEFLVLAFGAILAFYFKEGQK